MTAQEFVVKDPRFFEKENELASTWQTVASQARHHSSRDNRNILFQKARPGEEDTIREYRHQNDRLLTKEGVDKFISLSVRIFKNSHIDLSDGTINQQVMEWLETKPFRNLTQRVGLLDYFYTVAYRYAIEDPNCAWVAFPVSRNTFGQAPVKDIGADGQPITNEPVRIESRIIPSRKIILRDHVFAFEGEMAIVQIPELKGKGGKVVEQAHGIESAVYYMADEEAWWQYYPIANPKRSDPAEPRIIYELRLWYPHASGEIPVTNLPGTLSYHLNSSGESVTYFESVLHSYFEYSDEVTQRFSDHQATVLKFNHPKVIMTEMACSECHGQKFLTIRDPHTGRNKESADGNVIKQACGGCGGTGILKDPGPLQTLMIRIGPNNTLDKSGIENIYKEIAPPTEAIRSTHNLVFDLLERGKQTVGLDVLGKLNESGKAHEIRLEVVQDKLGDVAEQSCNSIEKFLEYVTHLLVLNEDEKLEPKVIRPKSLSVKPAELLLQQAKDSPECARLDAYMEYYSVRFRNDPIRIRVYELALGYSALVCLNQDEIETRLAKGAYNIDDVIKADRAVWAFNELTEETGFLNPEKTSEMYTKADALIQPFIPEIVPLT